MTIDDQIRTLTRRCERFLSEEDLRKKLERSQKSGKPLRIKFGMDPTAADLTIGNAVPLSVVRQFQDWGHKAVLIIGDFTARVGDPTGRNVLRPQLDGATIDRNAKRFVDQLGKVVLTSSDHLEVRHNSEWLGKMSMTEIIKLLSRKSVAQLLGRDDFAKRFAANVDIRLHELMYPLLQGWDSVMVDADVEMGGSDQLFNNLVGREFQAEMGQEPQVVIVTPLLVGTDGQVKMSKSKGNYIAIIDPPSGSDGIFGKVMSLPDNLLGMYYELLTEIPEADYEPMVKDKPRDAKIALAKHLITWLHTAEAAQAAEADFIKQFVKHEIPDEMPEVAVFPGWYRLSKLLAMAGLVPSSSEGIRKIREGAVRVNSLRVNDVNAVISLDSEGLSETLMPRQGQVLEFNNQVIVQVGSRRYAKVASRVSGGPHS